MPLCNDITKDREIRFTNSPTEANQAEHAVRLLIDIVGIELVTPLQADVLRVRYDIREITLHMLESALIDVGFSLHNSLSLRLKRGVIAYCEEALRSSLGVETEQQNLSLGPNRPGKKKLDPRADNWRNYV